MLIQIGAIHRLIRLFVRLSASSELGSQLGSLVSIIISLCRSAIIVQTEVKQGIVPVDSYSVSLLSPFIDDSMSNPAALSAFCILSEVDLKAVANRIFIVEGVKSCPAAFTELLEHISWSCSDADTCELIELLADCSIETAFSNEL